MDTNPQYNNILNALRNPGTTTDLGASTGKLTMQQEADNYNTFSQMMKDGVYLPDLTKRLKDLEDKVKNIEENPKTSKLDQELFEVMEAAVRGDPAVKAAKQKVANVKSEIIAEICIRDPRFKEALDEYRTAVNSAYIHQKESPPE